MMSQKSMVELKEIKSVYDVLRTLPVYSNMKPEEMWLILSKAKSLNIDPLTALNGGMFVVNGKIEMYAHLMNRLIRQHGHSIVKDEKSNNDICILHGRRKDNGDTLSASFSADEAKRAGIYFEKGPWGKYTADMLFSKALGRLARQLFPDVIQGCYVQGEISENPAHLANNPDIKITPITDISEAKTEPMSDFITDEQVNNVNFYLEEIKVYDSSDLKKRILDQLKISDLKFIPSKRYKALCEHLAEVLRKSEEKAKEETNYENSEYTA